MSMELVIEHGATQGERFPISQQRFTIGRGRQCDVILPDTRVSQCHTEIRWQDGAWVVYDLNSANGTWINRRRLNGPYQLRPGDQLGVGRTILSFSSLDPPLEMGSGIGAGIGMKSGAPQLPAAPVRDVGGPVVLALNGLTALGALMLIISALLNWFSYTLPIVRIEKHIRGVDFLIGRVVLVGGIIALLLALGELLLRLLLRSAARSSRNLAAYVRWIPWAYVADSGALIGLSVAQVIQYNQEARTELLLGLTIEDIVEFVGLSLSPEPGIFVAGAGFSLLLIGAIGQLAMRKSAV
jgi:hypothetical protein